MIKAPLHLRGTVWEDWIRKAPAVEIDPVGDAYHGRAREWLSACPGNDAPLNDDQHEQLNGWIARYRLDLTNARQGRPPVGMEKLLLPVLSLAGSVAGASVVATFANPTIVPASVVVTVCLSLVTIGYGLPVVLGSIRKARRWDLIEQIDRELVEIGVSRVPRAPLSPAGLPTLDLTVRESRIKAPVIRTPER